MDVKPSAHTALGFSCVCRELPGGNIMDEAFRLDEAEYLKLMSEMEQSFLAALLQDEAAFLTRLEAEDARDLDSLVSHRMHMLFCHQ